MSITISQNKTINTGGVSNLVGAIKEKVTTDINSNLSNITTESLTIAKNNYPSLHIEYDPDMNSSHDSGMIFQISSEPNFYSDYYFYDGDSLALSLNSAMATFSGMLTAQDTIFANGDIELNTEADTRYLWFSHTYSSQNNKIAYLISPVGTGSNNDIMSIWNKLNIYNDRIELNSLTKVSEPILIQGASSSLTFAKVNLTKNGSSYTSNLGNSLYPGITIGEGIDYGYLDFISLGSCSGFRFTGFDSNGAYLSDLMIHTDSNQLRSSSNMDIGAYDCHFGNTFLNRLNIGGDITSSQSSNRNYVRTTQYEGTLYGGLNIYDVGTGEMYYTVLGSNAQHNFKTVYDNYEGNVLIENGGIFLYGNKNTTNNTYSTPYITGYRGLNINTMTGTDLTLSSDSNIIIGNTASGYLDFCTGTTSVNNPYLDISIEGADELQFGFSDGTVNLSQNGIMISGAGSGDSVIYTLTDGLDIYTEQNSTITLGALNNGGNSSTTHDSSVVDHLYIADTTQSQITVSGSQYYPVVDMVSDYLTLKANQFSLPSGFTITSDGYDTIFTTTEVDGYQLLLNDNSTGVMRGSIMISENGIMGTINGNGTFDIYADVPLVLGSNTSAGGERVDKIYVYDTTQTQVNGVYPTIDLVADYLSYKNIVKDLDPTKLLIEYDSNYHSIDFTTRNVDYITFNCNQAKINNLDIKYKYTSGASTNGSYVGSITDNLYLYSEAGCFIELGTLPTASLDPSVVNKIYIADTTQPQVSGQSYYPTIDMVSGFLSIKDHVLPSQLSVTYNSSNHWLSVNPVSAIDTLVIGDNNNVIVEIGNGSIPLLLGGANGVYIDTRNALSGSYTTKIQGNINNLQLCTEPGAYIILGDNSSTANNASTVKNLYIRDTTQPQVAVGNSQYYPVVDMVADYLSKKANDFLPSTITYVNDQYDDSFTTTKEDGFIFARSSSRGAIELAGDRIILNSSFSGGSGNTYIQPNGKLEIGLYNSNECTVNKIYIEDTTQAQVNNKYPIADAVALILDLKARVAALETALESANTAIQQLVNNS